MLRKRHYNPNLKKFILKLLQNKLKALHFTSHWSDASMGFFI